MSEAKLSVLARMAGGDGPAAAAAPSGGAIADAATRAMKAACGSLLSAAVEARLAGGESTTLEALLKPRPDNGVYYWMSDDTGAPAALFVVKPGFAAAVAERLLGGALSPPPETSEVSPLAFDMAAALVDVAAPALNGAFVRVAGEMAPSLRGKRAMRLKAQALADCEALPVSTMKFDLGLEAGDVKGAVEIIFARDFLDRLETPAAPVLAARNDPDTDWPARLRRNVLACELPLAVILDTFSSSIGDLSRLEVGQQIELDPDALSALDISAMTDDGPVSIARGRLGAIQARKAVKLTTGVDPDFIRGL